jgi:Zn-dependent peptidase ImmA (M78 family)
MSYLKINQEAEKAALAIIKVIGKAEPTLAEILEWFKYNFDFKFEIKIANLSRQSISGMIHASGPKGNYKILIDGSEPKERQLFTLYHELAHLLQETGLLFGCFDGDITNSKEEERFCNRFAAAMLMPAPSFSSAWNSGHENEYIKRYVIAERYGVSKEAVINRARDLNLL